MNTKKIGAASFAVLVAAGFAAGCSKSTEGDSPVAFSPVTGDQFTSNPGAFQTDGIASPPSGVTMVGNPVAAQAVVNSGLPQGTITATSNNTTVYYPPAPTIPGLPVAKQPTAPAPMQRPANTKPWQYTQQQIDVYRQICETGTWNNYRAGVQVQTQTCWTLYGRQLGVKPWQPGQPRPWEKPDYPKPWFEVGFKADTPVMWVYPKDWDKPKPQPLISVSITLNLGNNPYRKPNPRFSDPYYPVWGVTPGRVVDVRGQADIVAPVYTESNPNAAPPVAPGVVLAPLPASADVKAEVALPGAKVTGNVNLDANVTNPTADAVKGAEIHAGSKQALSDAVGTEVDASVVDAKPENGNGGGAAKASAGASGTVDKDGANGGVNGGANGGANGNDGKNTENGGAKATTTAPAQDGRNAQQPTQTQTQQQPTQTEQQPTQQQPTQTEQQPTQQQPTQTQQQPTQTQQQPTQAPTTTTTAPAAPRQNSSSGTGQGQAQAPAAGQNQQCTPAQVQAGTCKVAQ